MKWQLYLMVLSLVLFCTSCAPNRIYRADYSACKSQDIAQCSANAIANYELNDSSRFHLGFVEFDDQGQIRDREQMRKVIDYFYAIAAKHEILVTVFVHGWHHSASQNDDNIASYKNLLARIALNEATLSKNMNAKPRAILGLYIGWRGDSIRVPYLNVSTFWERKKVAQDVGLQGVTEVLLRMEQMVNTKLTQGTKINERNSRMISIGHSFGGALLFSSVQQLLADRFFNSNRETNYQADAQGFGDLVLLVNPAFEAMRFSTLYDIAQEDCRQYFPTQLPKLAILTSKTDYATKLAFPAGRWLATLFQSHRKLSRYDCRKEGKVDITLSESKADRIAVGHFKDFHTHWLEPNKNQPKQNTMDYFSQLQKEWINLDYGDAMNFNAVTLKHLGNTTPRNPYLNIYVDKKIIPNHNDIWRSELIHFVEDLIMITSSAHMLNIP